MTTRTAPAASLGISIPTGGGVGDATEEVVRVYELVCSRLVVGVANACGGGGRIDLGTDTGEADADLGLCMLLLFPVAEGVEVFDAWDNGLLSGSPALVA